MENFSLRIKEEQEDEFDEFDEEFHNQLEMDVLLGPDFREESPEYPEMDEKHFGKRERVDEFPVRKEEINLTRMRDSHTLLIGDSRARWLGLTRRRPPGVTIRFERGMNVTQMEKVMEQRDLWGEKALIILVGLHCDFTRLRSTRAGLIMRSERLAQTEHKIERLGEKYRALLRMIHEHNPDAQVVTTVPYTPDVRRYATQRLGGKGLKRAGLSSLALKEDERHFRTDVAAFGVWWDANVGGPLFELENLREEGFGPRKWLLTFDGVNPSPHTRELFWRGMKEWLPRGGNTRNTPLPGPSSTIDRRVRVEEDYVEYGELTPPPQGPKRRREWRAWEEDAESEEETKGKELAFIDHVEEELLKRRALEEEREREIHEMEEAVELRANRAIEQIREGARREKRVKREEIERRYRERARQMQRRV